MIIVSEVHDISTPSGPMRTYLYRPAEGGPYPGILFFSEIFQHTGPIQRLGAFLAGNGYVVAVPEIFHELNPVGTVLPYDQAGADKGNADKVTKTLKAYDDDAGAIVDFLLREQRTSGSLGALGICIGGHLSFRAAFRPEIRAAACFYATDIHKRSLGAGMQDDSLDRLGEIDGELLMVWGRQDPHIPLEGRRLIYDTLTAAETVFTWHEFNAQHAFLRDEGPRYDPELVQLCYHLLLSFFHRRLSTGVRNSKSLYVDKL
ncbi:MAG: dienelactone hydrolase family protein [Bdellovibrionales bacterium]|nr:dienelactone hydrolase family protein [Bdellovibrionales bacterium]